MTDKQIIKYWNEIDSEIINEHGEEFDVYITMPVAKSTVDFINRQKAEVEELKEKRVADGELLNDRIQESVNAVIEADQKYINVLENSIATKDVKIERLLQKLQQLKSEAIKEFAERLKNNTFLAKEKNSVEHTIWIYEIDKIVKEMTEVQE